MDEFLNCSESQFSPQKSEDSRYTYMIALLPNPLKILGKKWGFKKNRDSSSWGIQSGIVGTGQGYAPSSMTKKITHLF